MDTLDLWIEFVDNEGEELSKFLIDFDYADNVGFQAVVYSYNPETWTIPTIPQLSIYSFLYDIYNVMVF